MEFNLADLWEAVVDAVPEREAFVCGNRRLTYAEADERATRLAHVLAARGVGAGDHVAVYLYNGVEYLETMLAAFKLRAVPINVNYRYVEDELHHLLDDSDATAVVFHREFAPKLESVHQRLPLLTTFVSVTDDETSDAIQHSLVRLGAIAYEDALANASPTRDFEPRSPDDLYILYTGGTTGSPKGVMWRAEDIFFAALGGGAVSGDPITAPERIVDDLGGTRRCLPACPFMHGTGHWFAFNTLFGGGTVVISPDRRFDAERLWRLIEHERVTFLVIVGDAFARPLVESVSRLEPAPDLSALRAMLSGGAILSPAVKSAWIDALPEILLIDGFGSSESGGLGQSVAAAGSDTAVPCFTLNDDTTVLGDDLEPVEVGVVGWLARRGRIPVGYYKDPERTAATFPTVHGVRWSVTGDHARTEPDGTITVLGRGSVSINTGGEKVFPEEIEAVLKSHRDVFDAIVVGLPDERWGQRVTAVVQPRPGARVAVDELGEHVRSHLAAYKAPRALVVVDAIVRSPSGKPDYRWARGVAEAALAAPDVRPSARS
ncbi:MAG: acyl-CoA synthetase [Acidimicrobiia bacterium]